MKPIIQQPARTEEQVREALMRNVFHVNNPVTLERYREIVDTATMRMLAKEHLTVLNKFVDELPSKCKHELYTIEPGNINVCLCCGKELANDKSS